MPMSEPLLPGSIN